jgi:nucleoside-diphosphate-sugar epimerase
MKTLVVGGTGMIGAHIAENLHKHGHEVSVMSRSPELESDPPAISGMARIVGDYIAGIDRDSLAPFTNVVFAAGQDIRHIDLERDTLELWLDIQGRAVPEFAAVARDAGVKRFVQIGSYYHHLYPEWAGRIPYVAGRKMADEGARALTTDGFAAITLNPPSIVGATPGTSLRRFSRMFSWLCGERPEEVFAPKGGTNYMSVHALAEAARGAIERGKPGAAYLVGGENLTFREFFQMLADVAGSTITVDERDAECPFLPDRFIVQGRGNVVAYDVPEEEREILGYPKGDVRSTLEELHRATL